MPLIAQGENRRLRDSNALHTLALPLPRLGPLPESSSEKFDVLIAGGGPAGAFLNLLLARYGIPASATLCIDARPETLKAGQADGIQHRTLEILKSMDLVDEILNHACHMHTQTVYKPDAADPSKGIVRESLGPLDLGKARYGSGCLTLHKGRVEQIFADDLAKYHPDQPIQRGVKLLSAKLDESADPDYPVVVELEDAHGRRTVRVKYLVGADGARSQVRKSFNINLEGETTDDIYGVIDLVVDTDFPDIRRMGNIHGATGGTVLLIPREKKPTTGDYLTRLYVPYDIATPGAAAANGEPNDDAPAALGVEQQGELEKSKRAVRATIDAEKIMAKAQEMFKPYRLAKKEGTEVEWWAAYQIGQRVAERLVERDSQGHPRVFLAGDSCHTHSPKAGQGMNVGMADSFDLAWKLAYILNALVPPSAVIPLLDTFASDRHQNAVNLISLDKAWIRNRYAKADGSMDVPSGPDVLRDIYEFVSGVGIQYDDGWLVQPTEEGLMESKDYYSGVLRHGRRFADTVVKRYATGEPWHLQDALLVDGCWRVVVFASEDIKGKDGRSAKALAAVLDGLVPKFPAGIVKPIVLSPLAEHSFEWADLPSCVKKVCEMDLYDAESAHGFYGVYKQKGAVVLVRPDQFVGAIVGLEEVSKVEEYLRKVLVPVEGGKPHVNGGS